MNMHTDNRTHIITRLYEDIIGPRKGADERLYSRPSDLYVTGILYPQQAEISDDDNEKPDEVNQGKASSYHRAEDSVAAFRGFRPATAGLSFALFEPQDKSSASLTIEIGFGQYTRMPNPDYVSPDERTTSGADPLDRKTVSEYCWQRQQRQIIQEIILGQKMIKKGYEAIDVKGGDHPSMSIFIKLTPLPEKLIATIQLINACIFDPYDDGHDMDEMSLFQCVLTVTPNGGTLFAPRQAKQSGHDEDEAIANLLYRDKIEYATGHTCSVAWPETDNIVPPPYIQTSWMPRAEVKTVTPDSDILIARAVEQTALGQLSAMNIGMSDYKDAGPIFELLTALATGYKAWIDKEDKRCESLPQDLHAQAKTNMDRCRQALSRMQSGIQYLKDNDLALRAFCLANLVMHTQNSWPTGMTDRKNLIWRPFQLAFFLLCLPSASDHGHPERDIFDLIWFPTGGGKTEAYLLLAAYLLIYRRFTKDKTAHAGVSIIMRYTLRTLTIQQFQRAAAMILACETVRENNPEENLGDTRFSIGLWVGNAATPNTRKDSYDRLHDLNPTSTPKQIRLCPICTAQLTWHAQSDTSATECHCPQCKRLLPIVTVDEDIYKNPPSFLIGTVDKFAQIVRKPDSGKLFGVGTPYHPPDLIIQDELHLISGPLGSLAGLYEIAIDELCRTEEGPVKIIGSTATIKHAPAQVRALYNRRAFSFPPVAIDDGETGFATTDKEKKRVYLGITTAGRAKKFALQAVSASLLQSGVSPHLDPATKEHYTTLVSYYNSLKELGGALVVMQDNVPKTLKMIAQHREEPMRVISMPEELTSRKSSADIPEILETLGMDLDHREVEIDKVKVQAPHNPNSIDVLLASNMLSVGVDIPRLGLMVVNGQPKVMSEYIQATSRVGRTDEGPGLIVTVYNHYNIRDRVHFETFKTWHATLYRYVEATSVTPFASRARDKALHAPLIALVRHKLGERSAKLTHTLLSQMESDLIPLIGERIAKIDQREHVSAVNELKAFLEYWEARPHIGHFWHDNFSNSLLISAEKKATNVAAGRESQKAKSTPNSLRDVEPSTLFKIVKSLEPKQERSDAQK